MNSRTLRIVSIVIAAVLLLVLAVWAVSILNSERSTDQEHAFPLE